MALAIALAFVGAFAIAGDNFDSLDTDGNGVLDADESMQLEALNDTEKFNNADTNNDGSLDRTEFADVMEKTAPTTEVSSRS
ncbi:MAG: EF-hand domain-containing protein [Gammaproteobacteria bacterium]|nr:EF-hand domain-containing protein [Gammaproteobacteria bacterium]